MDARSLNNLNTLSPVRGVRQDAIAAWTQVQAGMPANVQVIVIQGLRSFADSDHDFELGRTIVNPDGKSADKPMGDIITKASAGESYHNYGLAFDFAMVTNGKDDYVVGPNWMKVVAIMKQHGWNWGGDFPDNQQDNPHFEKHFGVRWETLLQLRNEGKLMPGTDYVIF